LNRMIKNHCILKTILSEDEPLGKC